MGLCYQTSHWLDRLWAEHLDMSTPARDLVEAGIKKQGAPFAGFPADLHARLYLPSNPQTTETDQDWATRLHTLASEIGEWQRLRSMCARNGFAAGVATEAMLNHLLPHLPEKQQEAPQDSTPDDVVANGSEGDDRTPEAAQTPQEPSPVSSGSTDAGIRASLRRAAREARDAVQQAEAEMEGLSTPLHLSHPGKAASPSAGPANLKAIRDAHTRLAASSRLRRIAELAGRLERIAASKAKSKVKPGVGEVHGIQLSGDLSKLLPSELMALRHPRLRLLAVSRLLQRRALSYGMTGREPQARGPIVILLDESISMREDARDIWSKAVCLALLSTATRQRRPWHLVAFNKAITREVTIPIGQATPASIQQALDHSCSGGTDFNPPVLRAVEIIRTSVTMRRADVVIVTDGENSLQTETIDVATSLTKTEGVSWFVIGVGPHAGLCADSLGPIATTMVRIKSTDDAELVVPIINLESAA